MDGLLTMDRTHCALRAFTCSLLPALLVCAGCNRAPESKPVAVSATLEAPQPLPQVSCTKMSEIVSCAAVESDGPSLALPNPVAVSRDPQPQNRYAGIVEPELPDTFGISPEDSSHQQPTTISPTERRAAPLGVSEPTFAPQQFEEPPQQSALLPWGPSTPTTEMAAVSQRAEQAARRGFNLAERGALYSARSQFIESLKIVAQAMDEQLHTSAHTKALAAGLRAMDEVNDFVPRNGRLPSDMNIQMIAAAHHTPVLKSRSLEQLTVADVQRLYLTYAQEQLAAASGDQAVGSLALHGMGKICTTPADMHGPREQIAEAKAVAYYQSALLVEPRNFMAANELGVILARYGRLKQSQAVLEQAVAQSASPTAYRNLAAVCEKLGEQDKAVAARHEGETSLARLQQSGHGAAGLRYPIEWVDPTVFANTNSMVMAGTSSVMSPTSQSANQPTAATATATPPAAPTTAAKKSIWPWMR
jgi:hypothetical protein